MKAKQWPRRKHNAPKRKEEKDATTEVEENRRSGKEAAGGFQEKVGTRMR